METSNMKSYRRERVSIAFSTPPSDSSKSSSFDLTIAMTPPFMNRHLEDLDNLESNTSDQFSRDVGSFEGRPPDASPPRDGRSSDNHEHQPGKENEFETSGSIDFAMRLHNDPEMNKNGAVVAMEKSGMALRCSIPSKSSSNFFASCEGNTGFMKQRGFATSNLSLGYNIRNNTALLYDWNTADGLSKVS